jgi:hypothetical protein
MSAPKELNFFVAELNGGRGLDWYDRQFDASAAVRGESSPAYASHPLYAGVPERIRAAIPDVRLVYLVRDPIERMLSHYRLIEPDPGVGSLAEAFEHIDHGPSMLSVSRYWAQLERYLSCFASDRILVVDADHLRDRRREALASVYEFVGVDPDFSPSDLDQRHNISPDPTRLARLGRTGLRGLERAVGQERARAVVRRVPAPLKAPFRPVAEKPAVTPELRERLENELRPDVERLRAHTGQRFAGWSL